MMIYGNSRTLLGRPILWLGIIGWWTLEGLVSAGQYRFLGEAAGMPVTWRHALATSLASGWLWILPTALAVWSSDRYALERDNVRAAAAMHVAGVIGVIVFRALAVVALNPWIGWYAEMPTFQQVLLTSFFNNVFIYLLLVGVGHALHYAMAARLRERQLEEAKLHVLKAQLQPHFLFNALNTISSFVRDDPLKAERMIARLGVLLRASLESAPAQQVALQDELELLGPYFEIEQARFEDRLTIAIDVGREALHARVPSLLLQPLVENAIRHGISRRAGPGRVEVRARREGAHLRIEVRDDGVGLAADRADRDGIGLSNVRARLRQLYGERHAFSVLDAPGGGVVATTMIPFVTVGSGPTLIPR